MRLAKIAALLVVIAGCSASSELDDRVNVALGPTADPVAVASVPTTSPILDVPEPGPTPITLSGGRGIVVAELEDDPMRDDAAQGDPAEDDPAEDPAEGDPAEDAEAAGDTYNAPGSDSYNTATATNEATPTATPRPNPTTTPPPASGAPAPVPTAAAAPEPTSNPAVSVANGHEVYTLNCARCHGADGLGSLNKGLLGVPARYSQASLVEELTNGHAFTFGFGSKLSATEIADVAGYVIATFDDR